MSIINGMLSFDLADTSLEQRAGQPLSLFSSGRVEIEGEETWADIQIVRQAKGTESHLTPRPNGWSGVVAVSDEWFGILQSAFLTPQTYLLNVAFEGVRREADEPLVLKDQSLTLMRSAATTEESVA